MDICVYFSSLIIQVFVPYGWFMQIWSHMPFFMTTWECKGIEEIMTISALPSTFSCETSVPGFAWPEH